MHCAVHCSQVAQCEHIVHSQILLEPKGSFLWGASWHHGHSAGTAVPSSFFKW